MAATSSWWVGVEANVTLMAYMHGTHGNVQQNACTPVRLCLSGRCVVEVWERRKNEDQNVLACWHVDKISLTFVSIWYWIEVICRRMYDFILFMNTLVLCASAPLPIKLSLAICYWQSVKRAWSEENLVLKFFSKMGVSWSNLLSYYIRSNYGILEIRSE